jgi:hypothetical protein
MRQLVRGVILAISAAALAAGAGATAQAKGTPQRSPDVPAGLSKNFERSIHGILRAIQASEGSNGRLQELPVSI